MLFRIVAIIFIILAAIGYSQYSKHSLEETVVSENQTGSVLSTLPQAEFTTLEGEPFKLEDLYQKESVDLLMVHFWGTWCAPCEAELPELLKFIKRFEGQSNIKFLLVAANDEAIKVKKHLKTLPIPSKSSIYWLLDNKDIHREGFGTTRVPETYVFSSDKRHLRKFVGPQEWNKPMFLQIFDELLQMATHKL